MTEYPLPWKHAIECEALRGPSSSHVENRPQAEPISVASVWQMESPETADAALEGKEGVFVYRRDGHPNERSLARKIAKLHGAETAMVTAQGMSAIAASALALLRPGDQVWVASELYGKTVQLFTNDLARWGISHQAFDSNDEKQLQSLADSKAKLVFVETLSNPRLRLAELDKLVAAVRAAGGVLVVDNTFATHLICRPLDHGADIVVESLSKQVNGHSDAMLGMVATADAQIGAKIRGTLSTFGMASSPLDCFLTHRGLTTLAVRLERACKNALELAQSLRELPEVKQVDYPGLSEHPQHQACLKQLRGGFGWMLTFQLGTSWEGVHELFEALSPAIPFLPSLGDVTTSVSHPASTSHRGLTPQGRKALGITDGTIRVSCGIEPTDWLVNQFCAAIQRSTQLE